MYVRNASGGVRLDLASELSVSELSVSTQQRFTFV